MKQRDGDGTASSSEVRGGVRGDKEESDVPFDPEATGVIPKLTFDTAPPEGPPSDDGTAEDAEPDSDTTMIRLPATLHIGHPPTVEEAADPDATGTVTTPAQGAAFAPPADTSATKPGLRPQPPSGPQATGDGKPAADAKADIRPQPASGPQAADGARADGDGQRGASAKATSTKPGTTAKPGTATPSAATPSTAASSAATSSPAAPGAAKDAAPGKAPAKGASAAEAPAKGSDGKPGTGTPSTAASNTAASSTAKGAAPKEAPAKRPVTEASAAGTVPVPIARPASEPSAGGAPAGATPAGTTPAETTPTGATPTGATPADGSATSGAAASGSAASGASASGAGAAAPVDAPQAPSQASPMPAAAPPAAPPQTAAPQIATKQVPPQQATPRPAPQVAPGKPRTLGGRIGALVASAPKWLPVLLVIEGLVMYILALKVAPGPLRGVNPDNIDGLGLISALPTTAFIAILIMIVSFFVTVAQSTDRKFLLLFQIAAITFALHGAGALVATAPRFPTAYIHAGFVEFISRTGESAISIDARMGWPGFFALFAFVTKAAGITDLTPILQWTPLVSNLLYLLPFVLILRQVVATTRARWFAALLFVLVQWIGQDYFSPQGFTFALYLAFIAILLRWFGRVEQRTKPIPPKGLRKLLGKLDAMTPGELANTGTYRADKLLMLMMLLALFVASVASHQITPFMMLGVVTAFLIFKRTSLTWGLPFFLGLLVLAWISYMTVGFWSSQIGAIFGGFGRILQNIGNSTGDRIEGSDPAHALVLQARLGILVVILSLAATGLFRRFRRGVFDRSALILLCVPVLALGLQSYGGEIGLRIYMFALPGACLLAAYAFFPNLPADSADVREETVPLRKRNVRFNPQLTKKLSVVLAACFAVLFAFAFLLARYGNEKFERVTTGEVAALHYVYQHDKPSAKVLYLVPKTGPEVTPTLPWGEKDVELVNFGVQARVYKDPTQISDAVAALKEQPRNSYLIVSRGQVSYLQLNEGFPEDWGTKFRAALDASPDLKRVFSNQDAALYTWKKFVRGTEIPEPQPYKGRGDPTTPWTPVGIGALAVTWVSLFAYEVIRLNGPNRARKTRKRLLFLAVPAFVVALAVIIERFIYIAQNN
ncbi:hypothetical protein ACFPOI_00390 [Nonomuraea angiospora]|uniref:Uncharacterized protein n=1 Tax=Nonomuraea angiospora TaxID=46172 RepID=A0ABR9M1U6_9ACTN|nr:hypothetical protein [Nonomuraea angiospora]MBE1586861.1 hypothetical protein [Nonomuraea angiospora]